MQNSKMHPWEAKNDNLSSRQSEHSLNSARGFLIGYVCLIVLISAGGLSVIIQHGAPLVIASTLLFGAQFWTGYASAGVTGLVSRKENPVLYWMIVLTQVALALFIWLTW